MRVAVYYNLHRRLFSVKALEGPDKGRVIAHREAVYVTDVTFRVREGGRQRVLREKRKNVHAFVIGTLGYSSDLWQHPDVIRYNPYKRGDFVDGADRPVSRAVAATLTLFDDKPVIRAVGLTHTKEN